MSFQVTICSNPLSWSQLELTSNLSTLGDAQVTSLWTDAQIPVISEETTNILEQLRPQVEVSNDKCLTRLFTKSFDHLKDLTHPQLPDNVLETILSFLPPMELAKVRRVSNQFRTVVEDITHLRISQKLTPDDLERLIEHFPNIQSYDFSDCRWMSDDHLKKFQGKDIQSLNLTGCIRISNEGLKAIEGLPLRFLSLFICHLITDEGLQFLKNMPLESLNLSSCYQITNAGIKALIGMPLQSLNLSFCKLIDDEGLEVLKGKPIRKLHLANCTLLTDKGLKTLLELPLQDLDINEIRLSRELFDSFLRKEGMFLFPLDYQE